MASIYIRGGVYYLKYYQGGRTWAESLRLKVNRANKKIANEKRLLKELELKTYRGIEKTVLLSSAIELFLIYKEGDTLDLSLYKVALRGLYNALNTIQVRQITPRNIKDYRDLLLQTKKHNTVRNYLKHLEVFFRYMIELGIIKVTPGIKLKEQTKEIRIIPDSVMDAILEYLKSHNTNQYRLIYFLYLTGFRRGEALSCDWSQVEFENNRIMVYRKKSNKSEGFPLYPKLREFLITFRSEGLIFNYSKNGLKFWNRTLIRLNLPHYSIHDIRRKFGTLQAEKGRTPYQLMKLLGHSSIKTTMGYYVNVDMTNLANEM